jgi:Fe-S cluster biogenesis protein NfuA
MEKLMTASLDDREFRRRMERIESLLREVEQFADPKARAHTREIVQAILDLHGAGLERMLEHIAAAQDAGLTLIGALSQDDLVGSLLLLHGLHPLDVETRVRQALDKVRPYLRSHGGNVELLGIARGVVRLRMEGSCNGCASSALTLKLAIEEAICEKAPDVTGIEVEGITNGQPVQDDPVRITLPVLHA